MLNDKVSQISRRIAASKKYQGLYSKTIERIVEDYLKKYPEKEVEKKARQLLHQIWGVFYPAWPDFRKLLKTFEAAIKNEENIKAIGDPLSNKIKGTVLPILKLHASTRERIPILKDFYQKIFKITGRPKTILDLASGLNPLTFFWLPEGTDYSGFDIDQEQAQFLKEIFKLLKVNRVKIGLGDVFLDRFPGADVVFLLKILPLIRQQQKTQSLEILEKQNAKWLVVFFPTKSLGGQHKNMVDFYTKQFQNLIRNQPWQTEKILFSTELVFIIKK